MVELLLKASFNESVGKTVVARRRGLRAENIVMGGCVATAFAFVAIFVLGLV